VFHVKRPVAIFDALLAPRSYEAAGLALGLHTPRHPQSYPQRYPPRYAPRYAPHYTPQIHDESMKSADLVSFRCSWMWCGNAAPVAPTHPQPRRITVPSVPPNRHIDEAGDQGSALRITANASRRSSLSPSPSPSPSPSLRRYGNDASIWGTHASGTIHTTEGGKRGPAQPMLCV
jgi:hypothetical protein